MKRIVRSYIQSAHSVLDSGRDESMRPIRVLKKCTPSLLQQLGLADSGGRLARFLAYCVLCLIYSGDVYVVLHHIDMDNTNNDLDNIGIISSKGHTKLHSESRYNKILLNDALGYIPRPRVGDKSFEYEKQLMVSFFNRHFNDCKLSQLKYAESAIDALSECSNIVRRYSLTSLDTLGQALAHACAENAADSTQLKIIYDQLGVSEDEQSVLQSAMTAFSKVEWNIVSGDEIDNCIKDDSKTANAKPLSSETASKLTTFLEDALSNNSDDAELSAGIEYLQKVLTYV